MCRASRVILVSVDCIRVEIAGWERRHQNEERVRCGVDSFVVALQVVHFQAGWHFEEAVCERVPVAACEQQVSGIVEELK